MKYQSGSIFIVYIPTTLNCTNSHQREIKIIGGKNEVKSRKFFSISFHGHGTG
jgi:hypothetical protein